MSRFQKVEDNYTQETKELISLASDKDPQEVVRYVTQLIERDEHNTIPWNKRLYWDSVNTSSTPLLFFISIGHTEMIHLLLENCKILRIELNGVQSNTGYTPLFAAQKDGYLELMILLLLFGATPEPIVSSEGAKPIEQMGCPGLPGDVAAQVENLWATYSKYRIFGLALDYPQVVSIYNKFVCTTLSEKTSSAIDRHLAKTPKLKYMKRGTTKAVDAEGSLYECISMLLSSRPDVATDVKEWVEEMRKFVIEEIATNVATVATLNASRAPSMTATFAQKISFSPFFVISQKYSVNVIVLGFNSDGAFIRRPYYANPNNKKAMPYIYLIFNGIFFQPLIDKDHDPSFKPTYSTTPLMILDALKDEKTTEKEFCTLLNNFDPSLVNNLVQISSRVRTILYACCRSGRIDFVSTVLSIPGIQVNGLQDEFSGSSPLHVACWNGFLNIVVILLLNGADPNALNNSKEPTLIMGPHITDKRKHNMLSHITRIIRTNNWEAKLRSLLKPTELLTSAPEFPIPKVVGLDELCSYLGRDDPPDYNTFQLLFQKFDKERINDQAVSQSANPLYLACRSGSLPIVKKMAEECRGKIKLDGHHSSRMGNTVDNKVEMIHNTALHVANWRGHSKVVAYLLSFVNPEKNSNGKTPGSSADLELFHSDGSREHRRIETELEVIFSIATTLPLGPERSRKLARFYEDPPEIPPIPISNVPLEQETEEILMQYSNLNYFWYTYEARGTAKRCDLSTSSSLDYEYAKFCASTDRQERTIKVYSPATLKWSDEEWIEKTWKVDFVKMTFTEGGANLKNLKAVPRAPLWYYQDQTGVWRPLNYLFCLKIKNALLTDSPTCHYQISKGHLFKDATDLLIHFEKKTLTMSGYQKGEFPVRSEREMKDLYMWSYDFYDLSDKKTFITTDSNGQELTRAQRQQLNLSNKTDIVELQPDHHEYKYISEAFFASMPSTQISKGKVTQFSQIVKITKYYSGKCRKEWFAKKTDLIGQHEGNPIQLDIDYHKFLWHGTGTSDPITLSSEKDWKPNFSSGKNLWGKGYYFASDASYSANNAFKTKNGTKILLIADVLVGQPIQAFENSKIKRAPPNYNSIVGSKHGSLIYVVPSDLSLVFPCYSVEWKEVMINQIK